MASVPVANSKQMVGSGAGRRNARNNLPTRLIIPTSPLTPTSLVNSSNGSNATQQRVTSELINAIRTTTQPPFEDDGDLFYDERISGPNGEKIDLTNLKELCKLGKGAGGTVIKVKNTSTGHLMAKKKLNVVPEQNIYRQILRELQFLRTCHSPNIVSYYGAILEENNSSIAIFMEYCEGGSLDEIYKNMSKREGRLGEPILGKICESVLKGLVYLHSQQIIHRDIKPSNILVTKKGEIKICDFGESGKLVKSIADTFLGTSYYMAPERILGRPYKVSADVWSLGLTIMEVAQNRFPYPDFLSPIELVVHITNLPAPTLSKEYKWSEEIEDFLKICLEKDGVKRPSPKQILDHPFIQLSSQRSVDSGFWIKQVWEG